MADKKWSEFLLVKDLKGKDVDLLTILKDNSYTNEHWDNKRVRLADILDPIESKIADLKTAILQIETGVAGLTTVGVKKPVDPWYNNTSDPEDELLVELSIAKDLYKSVSKNESDIKIIEGDIDVIEQNITNINGRVSENKSNIVLNSKLLNLINNSYFHKGNIVTEIKEDDNPDTVPTSNAVYNFVEDVKNDLVYEIDYETSRLWQKINNLDLKCIHFDDTAKDGQSTIVFEIDDFVINKKDQKVFVVDSGHYYKELSLNRPEVLEIANKVVDWHNSNIKETYENEEYVFQINEAHKDFQGKCVGKTNNFDFTLIDPIEYELGIDEITNSCLFVSRSLLPQEDCYIMISGSTDCRLASDTTYGKLSDYLKEKYKSLFNLNIIVKVFWEESLNKWKIDFRYSSYSLSNVKNDNIKVNEIFTTTPPFYIKVLSFKDFHQSNSSEIFNDYKQVIPHEIDYFHSVHNLNNKFTSGEIKTVDIVLTSFLNPNNSLTGSDTYALVCDSSGVVNLVDYVGYYMYISPESEVICSDPSITLFKTCFNVEPKNHYYLILKGYTEDNLLNPIYKAIIAIAKYNLDGVYESELNIYKGTTLDDNYNSDGTDLKLSLLPITIKNVSIYANAEGVDSYSLSRCPSFMAGYNNLCSAGGLFIFGNNNIPTNSRLIIGEAIDKTIDLATNSYITAGSQRDNIFEVDKNGLIFIKSQKNLLRSYKDYYGNHTNQPEGVDNNGDPIKHKEVLDLEYKCLQKILIDLNTRIIELENRVRELENP